MPRLHELRTEVHKGQIQLPVFRRGWVWDDEHIRELVASLSLSYPVGTAELPASIAFSRGVGS